MPSLVKTLLLGATWTVVLASPVAAEDWSGWWGGLSVGGAHSSFDTGRISDGTRFCVTETTGGASATCRFGPESAGAYTSHELDGSSFSTEQTADPNGVYQPNPDLSDLEPGYSPYAQRSGYSIFSDTRVLITQSGLSSSTETQNANVVAALNLFDFGAVPDLSTGSFAVGGHVRRDWQTEKGWIVGVEGELAGLFGGSDSWSAEDDFEVVDSFQAFATQSLSVKAQALGSLRVRFGRDMGSWMPYVTGGLGVGWFKAGLSKSFEETASAMVSFSSSETAREVLFGGVIGAGVQHRLNEVTTLSGEVLYYHFNGSLGFNHDQSVGVDNAMSVMFKLSRKLN